jgi:phage tail sheath protein FI
MMLRTIMRSDNLSFPWFAPAGARRGLVDNASDIGFIDSATNEFVRTGVKKSIRDSLYENKVNPITRLPGTGILNYGQKTRYGLTSALDRINVARLIAYVRKALQPLSNNFLFEPNDKVTRDQIKQAVEGLMNDLVAKRALYDYLVVCDDTNNTPDRIARNELYVDIAIAPVRAVEFIYIPLRVRNPGDI